MANLEVNFPEDFMKEVLQADTGELCREMVDAASPIMVESMKKEMAAVVSHDGESEMVNSVKTSKATTTKNGAYISFTGPTGNSKKTYYGKKRKRKYPVSNALKAIWLNYGRKGQPARPFLTKATNNAEAAVIAKMQEVYNRRMGGGK